MSDMQQKKRKLSLPYSTPPQPTLLEMPTYVETSRNQIQRNKIEGNPWSGANPTPGHTLQHEAWQHRPKTIRQLAEITYKDVLKEHGCLDMEDLQFEAEFLTWDQASQNSFVFACYLTSTLGIEVSWDPFHPDWIASSTSVNLAQAMITTQHLVHI